MGLIYSIRRHGLRVVLVSVSLATSVLRADAAGPAWWSSRGVFESGATPDDFAVANLGQLKHFAAKAADELNATLPNGAGSVINGLVTSWNQPPAPDVDRDDFAVLNQGQLKAVAKLFYDRLNAESVVAPYPWGDGVADDYAVANIGQLKFVFCFVTSVTLDSDDDGLPDIWELRSWGRLTHTALDDSDSDGVNNLVEYLQGRDPTKGVVSDSSGAIGLRVYSPIP